MKPTKGNNSKYNPKPKPTPSNLTANNCEEDEDWYKKKDRDYAEISIVANLTQTKLKDWTIAEIERKQTKLIKTLINTKNNEIAHISRNHLPQLQNQNTEHNTDNLELNYFINTKGEAISLKTDKDLYKKALETENREWLIKEFPKNKYIEKEVLKAIREELTRLI